MDEAVRRFTEASTVERLPGGQGRSVRAGALVLKPVDELRKHEWLGDALERVDFEGLKVAVPVRSRAGRWCEQGLGATRYFGGGFVEGRIADKLAAADAFHRATRLVARPPAFDAWRSPWIEAARVAWHERGLPDAAPQDVKAVLSSLRARCEPVDLPSQFVHTDLAGNILFDGDAPVVIDISPAFRPVAYAHTVLVADSVAWHHEPAASLEALGLVPSLRRQLVLRAVVFRLCVPLFVDVANAAAFHATWREFEPVLAFEGIVGP
ncbi:MULTISPECIES: phosphotransferase [unclassified Rhizobacter]|uniref:phosphotransferase n=1 Tax=unclassified Rhizobacter TaxID=2640088 RepID=UPI0007008F78|nr:MULTISPECIES: phosphotransferase [unclassified Rhizobacter]KQU80849.1 hypothetical protein ASC88_14980 [Rhizobacter sp. Root29]KQW04392.1 hypothetical protein ASC98_04670 [Rhizobacter sp. Root1238]KRB14477.1 hypothetical protein ASE08_08470 [Rhizobacter sp. Root16D2]